MSLESEIKGAINRACRENVSGTPDFILAEYLIDCLTAYEKALARTAKWYMPKEEYLAAAELALKVAEQNKPKA